MTYTSLFFSPRYLRQLIKYRTLCSLAFKRGQDVCPFRSVPISRVSPFPLFLLGEAGHSHNSSRNLTDKSKAASSGLLFLPPFSPRKKMGGGGEECSAGLYSNTSPAQNIWESTRFVSHRFFFSLLLLLRSAILAGPCIYVCTHRGKGRGTKDLDAKSLFFFGSGFSRKK